MGNSLVRKRPLPPVSRTLQQSIPQGSYGGPRGGGGLEPIGELRRGHPGYRICVGWPCDAVWWARVKPTRNEWGASEDFVFMEERHAAHNCDGASGEADAFLCLLNKVSVIGNKKESVGRL